MEITANAIQSVTAGSSVIFTETPVPGKCSIVHREGSGQVKVRATGCAGQCRARFRATFGGNIAIPSGSTQEISLAISLDGEAIGPTVMRITPAAAAQYNNVSASIFIDVPAGCCSTISVKNTSTITINVQNANLIVERVA